jgi:uncharacterized membrane protein YccC
MSMANTRGNRPKFTRFGPGAARAPPRLCGVAIGVRAWLLRRDPGLVAVRRAVRVAAIACAGFYVGRYLVHDPVMATYALFAAIAMGFLSQIPGPARRRSATLLWSLPVACLLVTAGTLLAGTLWAATAGMLVFGFFIAYAGVGGQRVVGLTAGMQLFFILPCFPPYAPDTLASRLVGVTVGLGLLALSERTLWPDADPVSYEARLADACDGLANVLAARATDDPNAAAALANAEESAQAIRPLSLPPGVRPASAGRHDQALSDAGSMLRFTVARLREAPALTVPPVAAAELLDTSARTAGATAQALRGDSPPDTHDLADAFSAAQRDRGGPAPHDSDATRTTRGSMQTADGVWAMATAVRVAQRAPIESGHGTERMHRERFPYAYSTQARLWWQRFAVHLTPRSVYFQGALRAAGALAAARLVAGILDLSHGFWVLLATLTLLRSRAADTRIALRPAVVGTIAGAAVVGVLLVAIGPRPDIYAAMTPPIMVAAFAAGALIGPGWGQALFTVMVTLVFTQLAPAGVQLAGARVVDVLVGAAIGVGAGVLAWPRGAAGELRRSAARFIATGGEAVRETALVLTDSRPPPALTGPTTGAMPRVRAAMALADASYGMYQTERHGPSESTVDWQAVIAAGHHIVRGSELLRDTHDPGSLVAWRRPVNESAANVAEGCGVVAKALHEGRDPRATPIAVRPAPDPSVADVQAWLSGIADDLRRVRADPLKGHA